MDERSFAAKKPALPTWHNLTQFSRKPRGVQTLAVCIAVLGFAGPAVSQERPVDVSRSQMVVRVYKSGVFSPLGHDHEVAAPIEGGAVDLSAHTIALHLNAASLSVQDKGISTKDRGDIQGTMLGPQVLDAARYPQILFRSTHVASENENSWMVQGDLTLHGETRPVAVEVQEKEGHYVGSARFRQTEFGIKPIKLAGGAIRVKDEIRIEFDIQLVR